MMKINVNNKPLSKENKQKHKKKQVQKEKFKEISIEALMDYIEQLEARIETLEEKNK